MQLALACAETSPSRLLDLSRASSFAIARVVARIRDQLLRPTSSRRRQRSHGYLARISSRLTNSRQLVIKGASAAIVGRQFRASSWTVPCSSCLPASSTAPSTYGPMHTYASTAGQHGSGGSKTFPRSKDFRADQAWRINRSATAIQPINPGSTQVMSADGISFNSVS